MKRFTETDKWKDPWFRSLSAPAKLVFFYIVDNCNNAGFIELDIALMVFFTGMKEEHVDNALKSLQRGVLGPCEGWYWVRRFLRHQKNDPINPANPAHRQIITLLDDQAERFSAVPEFQEFLKTSRSISPLQGASKGLLSPIGIGKGKGTGTGNGQVKRAREKSEAAGRCSLEEAKEFTQSIGLPGSDGEWFFYKCEGCGWMNNGRAIKDWKSTVHSWKRINVFPSQKPTKFAIANPGEAERNSKLDRRMEEARERVAAMKRTGTDD